MWQPQGIYSEFVLRMPTILVGEKAVSGLYNFPAARIAVVHGSTFKDYALYNDVFKKKDIKFFLRSWNGEPNLQSIKGTIHDIEKYAPDTIIAVGGGSVIDGAKLCRLYYEIPFFRPEVTKTDGDLLKTNFIAIPTTIGSGAEISSAAVYVSNHRKEMVVLHTLQPEVVVYDTRYIEDTPEGLLCVSAMDAVAHITEGYVSNIKNTMVEIFAEETLGLLKEQLERYLFDEGFDFSRLQYAGYMGGIIQNHCIVGAAHAVAHQLTEYGFSHSEGVALLLPHVIRLNSEDKDVKLKYQKLCKVAGFNDVVELYEFLERINVKSGIANRYDDLRDILLGNRDNEQFIMNIKNDRGGKGNPVEITDTFIRDLIGSI